MLLSCFVLDVGVDLVVWAWKPGLLICAGHLVLSRTRADIVYCGWPDLWDIVALTDGISKLSICRLRANRMRFGR